MPLLSSDLDGIDGVDLGIHDGQQYALVYDTLKPRRNPFAVYAKVYRRRVFGREYEGWLWVCWESDLKKRAELATVQAALDTVYRTG